MQTTEFIWFDGKLVPWDQAQVHVMTHSLHYGCAVFEGIRAYKTADGGSAVFRLKEHVARLFNSAKIMEMEIPFSEEDVCNGILETLKVNKLDEGYIRPLSFIGAGAMGVHPSTNPIQTIIAVWPWGAYLGAEALEQGIRVKTSTFTRLHVNVMMTKAKTSGNYANSILAKREAVADGYDEALMLDTEGYVSEATGENIFLVRNGVIKTPPLTSVLDGLTRNSLITLARGLGYEVVEQRFTRDELYSADEAFFCGTAAEVTPIREVDRRVIGAGHAGEVTKHLQKEYFKLVRGENPEYAHWLDAYSL
ncbi:branched-chain amino acid transaminase [Desulfobaculum bizertense]|uniref:Branched-chain-amino-acid aminotransferase n=1 Tax=Desulfobaculum bizertense DSM 18034 TaxID=1121442 RepID=A0A1T4W6A0_9BACT|nr:branched-chain amino acid transaminase [Desulfobaculum bizertense]UIJ39034.1 branched-chain amino acid transaminase [Desulfobaculum bizertense]SKA72824.1 branched chain amino acid aminotransferase apoenzyme [Desulfobaculum bizertense DSM 18034]